MQGQPQFAAKRNRSTRGGKAEVDYRFDAPKKVDRLMRDPSFADRCDWSKLGGWDWVKLLKKRPEFADKCRRDQVAAPQWEKLVKLFPQLGGGSANQ